MSEKSRGFEGEPGANDEQEAAEIEPVVEQSPENKAPDRPTLEEFDIVEGVDPRPKAERRETPYTATEIAEAIKNHFERSETITASEKLRVLLETLMAKLDKEQQATMMALLKEKARELYQADRRTQETIAAMSTLVAELIKALDRKL